VHSRHPL